MAEAEKKKGGIWSRRDFFTRLGWGGFGVFSGLTLLGFLRSAFPRVLFQPPQTFKAGFPSDYAVGEVSVRFQQDQRVWIVREEKGSCSASAGTPARYGQHSQAVAATGVGRQAFSAG